MKRISIWLILLAMMPGFAEAGYYSYYVPPRYRVHYSPYALRYEGTALVPGGLDYSVHAVSYGSSGLVYEGVRYTPYALGYNSSGLIYAYSSFCSYPGVAYPVYSGIVAHPSVGAHRQPAAASCVARATRNTPQTTRHAQGRTQNEMNATRVIREHLQTKGFDQVSVNRVLSIDGNIISADFTIRELNLLVKYWNPDQIDALGTKSRLRLQAYKNYKRDWERFAEQYARDGGTVCSVTESNAQTIVAALDSCPALELQPTPNGEPESPAPAPMYAKD